MIHITVEGVPPSVNSYVRHTRWGIHYKTKETKNWEEKFGFAAIGQDCLTGKRLSITITVFLGKGQRGDWDNFPKLIGDCAQRKGLIASDSRIKHGEVFVERDWAHPRTEIQIEEME